MTLEELRPVLTGLLGGLVSMALARALSGWLPKNVDGKSAATLVEENRRQIRAANAVFAVGIGVGLVSYQWAGFSSNDWRPLGLAAGLVLAAPLLAIPLSTILSGGSVRQALAAYAIYQKLPPFVLYSISVLGLIILMASVASLL